MYAQTDLGLRCLHMPRDKILHDAAQMALNDILVQLKKLIGSMLTMTAQMSLRILSLGTVIQSIVSLTNSLLVKMLIVLVSTISNSQVFLLKKCE